MYYPTHILKGFSGAKNILPYTHIKGVFRSKKWFLKIICWNHLGPKSYIVSFPLCIVIILRISNVYSEHFVLVVHNTLHKLENFIIINDTFKHNKRHFLQYVHPLQHLSCILCTLSQIKTNLSPCKVGPLLWNATIKYFMQPR